MRHSIDQILTSQAGSLPRPEDLIELNRARIVRFAEIVGRENVIASTDCGLGGRVHPQIAWAKLESLSQGAAIATKRLWR